MDQQPQIPQQPLQPQQPDPVQPTENTVPVQATTPFTQQQVPPASTPPVYTQPAPAPTYPANATLSNPGKGFGIASIILAVLSIWPVGLALGILSIIKSNKAKMSPVLGVVGTVLNVLAIAVTGLMLMIGIATFKNIQERARQNQTTGTSSVTTSSVDVPMSSSYVVDKEGGNAYWTFPGSYLDWKVTEADVDGRNTLQSTDNAQQFLSFQGFDSKYTGSDSTETASAIASYLSTGNATKTGVEGTMNFEQISDGTTVEFVTQRYTFTSSNGVAGRGILAARVFDGGHILLVTYRASDSAYNEATWDTLSAKMQINDGVM